MSGMEVASGELVKDKAGAAGVSCSGVAPGYVQLCSHCKKEIPEQMVQQGGCHMHCYNTEIDVWFISLPDAPDHGFYEADPDQVMERLANLI